MSKKLKIFFLAVLAFFEVTHAEFSKREEQLAVEPRYFIVHNPTALLLFDEIEKAHTTVIQLSRCFLQMLDAGRLRDRYH